MNFSEMHLTEWDFERLVTNATKWRNDTAEMLREDRFENMTPGTEYNTPWSNDWEMGYWISAEQDASIVLARMFLAQHGWACEILWDLADHRNDKSVQEYLSAGITPPPIFCYLILTNYVWPEDRV